MFRFSLLLSCAVFVSQAVTAAPCTGFTDVDDSSGFCVNVEWMKNRGITLGITPTLYGPNAPVTRLQMAVFMYRLGFQNDGVADERRTGNGCADTEKLAAGKLVLCHG